MTGKLKTKGNMMLATKLDGVLKVRSLPPFLIRFSLTWSLFAPGRQGQALSYLSCNKSCSEMHPTPTRTLSYCIVCDSITTTKNTG